MNSSSPTGNALSLRLDQGSSYLSDSFQLNRQSFSNLNNMIITTFETEHTVTLVCNGLVPGGKYKRLNILEVLKSRLLKLVESGKEDVIAFHCTGPHLLDYMEVPPTPSPQHPQIRRGLITDSTSELWKTVLQPRKQYELRFSKSKGEVWSYYSNKHKGSFKEILSSQKLHVGREDSTIRFTVYDDPAPPKRFARLEITPEECSLSGNPPFKIVIEFSTDSKQPIKIDKSRSALSVDQWLDLNSIEQLINCEDVETGEEVDWPSRFGCFTEDPHPSFPKDDDFVEILSDKPWRFEYILKDESSGDLGGLECLESGRTYKAQVATTTLSGFSRWKFGLKKNLLDGSAGEKKQRWEMDHVRTGLLAVETQSESVVFKAVN